MRQTPATHNPLEQRAHLEIKPERFSSCIPCSHKQL